jgi:mannose/fructose-specific phosphotransferase system component IIA
MKFGIREAQAAGLFARTREQKETVLAVVSMLNIPIVLQKQVNKKAKKLNTKITAEINNVTKAKKKADKAQKQVNKYSTDKDVIAATSVDWAV